MGRRHPVEIESNNRTVADVKILIPARATTVSRSRPRVVSLAAIMLFVTAGYFAIPSHQTVPGRCPVTICPVSSSAPILPKPREPKKLETTVNRETIVNCGTIFSNQLISAADPELKPSLYADKPSLDVKVLGNGAFMISNISQEPITLDTKRPGDETFHPDCGNPIQPTGFCSVFSKCASQQNETYKGCRDEMIVTGGHSKCTIIYEYSTRTPA
jgi:hypothetical protein